MTFRTKFRLRKNELSVLQLYIWAEIYVRKCGTKVCNTMFYTVTGARFLDTDSINRHSSPYLLICFPIWLSGTVENCLVCRFHPCRLHEIYNVNLLSVWFRKIKCETLPKDPIHMPNSTSTLSFKVKIQINIRWSNSLTLLLYIFPLLD